MFSNLFLANGLVVSATTLADEQRLRATLVRLTFVSD